MKLICSKCKKDVNVTYEVAKNKWICFNCLYPHEKERALKDEILYGWKAK